MFAPFGSQMEEPDLPWEALPPPHVEAGFLGTGRLRSKHWSQWPSVNLPSLCHLLHTLRSLKRHLDNL